MAATETQTITLHPVPGEGTFVPFAPKEATNLKSAEQVEEGATEHVLMHFPKRVLLTTQNHQIIEYKPGVHRVPADLADHQWLKANGVVRHVPGVVDRVTVMQGQTGAEARAAQEERDAAFRRLTTSLTQQTGAAQKPEPAPKPAEPAPVQTQPPSAAQLAKAKAEEEAAAKGMLPKATPAATAAAAPPTQAGRRVAPKAMPGKPGRR